MPRPPALVTIATRPPARQRLAGEHRGGVEHLADRLGARITPACWKSASTLMSAAASSAPVCEDAARAGRRGERPLLTAMIGLTRRDPARDPPEAARVAERLEVEQDRPRCRVALPVLQQVVARQVGLVADRDERRQADPRLAAELHRREPQGAALRRPARPRRGGGGRARTSRSARPPDRCSARRGSSARRRARPPTGRPPAAPAGARRPPRRPRRSQRDRTTSARDALAPRRPAHASITSCRPERDHRQLDRAR